MIKRTKQDCEACRYFVAFQTSVGMDFVICGYGSYNTYSGFYKFMDGQVNCPQIITDTLNGSRPESSL